MLYDLGLTVTYSYEGQAASGRHIVRLGPLDLGAEQSVVAASLDIDPEPDERVAGTDFFGNRIEQVYLGRPHGEIRFRLSARVQREPRGALLNMAPPVAALPGEAASRLDLAPRAPHHFTGPSPRIAIDAVMTEWAERVARGAATAPDAVVAIGRALHAEMRFDGEATEVDTTPRAAFDARHGVCQDYTQIMIACLRGIGIPAGYTSGYLRTLPPPGRARLAGADAMHAWVRAWCGHEMGWTGYDPTNAMAEGEDHIIAAVGRDYADVAPVRGVARSAGGHETAQAVDVIPLDAAGV
jgi:transglutaminase-like putative cysteine protease